MRDPGHHRRDRRSARRRRSGLARVRRAAAILGPGALAALLALWTLAIPFPGHAFAPRPFEVEHGPTGLSEVSDLLRDGEWTDAVTRGRELLSEVESEYGPESLETALVLDRLVEALWRAGKAADPDVVGYADRAQAIQERVLGPDHPEVAQTLQTAGNLFSRRGEYEEAETRLTRALAIREAALGPTHERVAGTLNDLGILAGRRGEHARAATYLERTLAIREEILPPGHRELAETLGNLGWLYNESAEYPKSIAYSRRALSIMEKIEGPMHPMVLGLRSNTAVALLGFGDHESALSEFRGVLAALLESLGPDHRETGKAYHNIAVVNEINGDYAAAYDYAQKGLDVFHRALGPDHPILFNPMTFMGDLSLELGDVDRAERWFSDALDLARSIDPTHPDVASALKSLGRVHLRAGRLDEAETVLTEALAIAEKNPGAARDDEGGILATLSDLADARGQLDAAIDYAARAVETYAEATGERNVITLTALRNLAVLEDRGGHHDRAVAELERVVSGFEDMLGPDHPEVGQTLIALARAEIEIDPERAFELALDAEGIVREHQRIVTRALPEGVAIRYAAVRASGRDIALTLASRAGPSNAGGRDERALDAVIHSRAVVLDEMASRHRAISGDANVELIALRERERRARARLANLVLLGPENIDSEHHRRLLDEARDERDAAERALAAAGELSASPVVGLDDVRRHLDPSQALVSLVRYDDAIDERGRYAAFVTTADRVTLVPLGDADDVDAAIRRCHDEAGLGALVPGRSDAEAEAAYVAAAGELAALVWTPVRSHLGAAARVFIVPDGLTSLIDVAALPTGDGDYVIDEPLLVHLVSAERDLVRDEPDPLGHGLLAFGAPEFDRQDALVAAADPASAGAGPAVYRGSAPGCPEFRDVRFESLPAAATEVEDIEGLWSAFDRTDDVTARTGAAASEAAFKALAPGHRVLHVATHGFFAGRLCAADAGGTRGLGGLTHATASTGSARISSTNPLTLSGLVFAGANARDASGPDDEDGLLTAEEISALDLRGVEWAVLSACETGRGEIHDAEGVLGLRRAFQVAGARTVVMSLWPIDDRFARDWMIALYRARLAEGLGTAEAVKAASRASLERRRAAGASTHPYYWAGFVASGDWR